MDYNEFLKTKMCIDDMHGFEINQDEINPKLYPHQRDIVQWAILGGRRARGSELGTGYFLDSVKYLQGEERNAKQMTLFDAENINNIAA